MAHHHVQSAVAELLDTVGKITDDLDQPTMDRVVRQLDRLTLPVSNDDALALLSLLPEGGDTALEVNWTVLHAIEACPGWPLWHALNQPEHEWMRILELRLNNAGLFRPASA